MDWKDVAGKISSAAPGVGALIGTLAAGPVVGTAIGGAAGKALQMLASLFGISSSSVTPDQLDAAIASDPQAVLKLRMAEMDHEKDMANIALEEEKLDHEQTKVELQDVQNARSREIEIAKAGKSNFTFYSVGWIITIGFFMSIVLIMFKPIAIDGEMRDVLNMLLGYLASNFNVVVSYFYGSSKSSADKGATMDRTAAVLASTASATAKELAKKK